MGFYLKNSSFLSKHIQNAMGSTWKSHQYWREKVQYMYIFRKPFAYVLAWIFLPKKADHAVDEKSPKQPPNMYDLPCKSWDIYYINWFSRRISGCHQLMYIKDIWGLLPHHLLPWTTGFTSPTGNFPSFFCVWKFSPYVKNGTPNPPGGGAAARLSRVQSRCWADQRVSPAPGGDFYLDAPGS